MNFAMQTKQIAGLFAGALGLYALTQSAVASPRLGSARQDGVPLTLKPAGASDLRLGFMAVPVKLDAAKPAGVEKEPKYASTPKYGVITRALTWRRGKQSEPAVTAPAE